MMYVLKVRFPPTMDTRVAAIIFHIRTSRIVAGKADILYAVVLLFNKKFACSDGIDCVDCFFDHVIGLPELISLTFPQSCRSSLAKGLRFMNYRNAPLLTQTRRPLGGILLPTFTPAYCAPI